MDKNNEHDAHEAEHGDDHDHGGNGKYWMVFFALCILTTASFLTYFPFWHDNVHPAVSHTFMMAVSCTKAFLVMAFFMHLIWEANWKYVLTIPAGMMSIFLMLMLVPDVGCRYDTYTYERLIHAADPHTGTSAHGHGEDGEGDYGHGKAGDDEHPSDEHEDESH